jgi:hypothetical protein
MALPYGKIIMDSGREVLFEIEGPITGPVSNGVASCLRKRFGEIMEVIKETAESAYSGLERIEIRARPDEYEIKFGLKLNAGADAIFAKAGSEGSFEVTLRWTAEK